MDPHEISQARKKIGRLMIINLRVYGSRTVEKNRKVKYYGLPFKLHIKDYLNHYVIMIDLVTIFFRFLLNFRGFFLF